MINLNFHIQRCKNYISTCYALTVNDVTRKQLLYSSIHHLLHHVGASQIYLIIYYYGNNLFRAIRCCLVVDSPCIFNNNINNSSRNKFYHCINLQQGYRTSLVVFSGISYKIPIFSESLRTLDLHIQPVEFIPCPKETLHLYCFASELQHTLHYLRSDIILTNG